MEKLRIKNINKSINESININESSILAEKYENSGVVFPSFKTSMMPNPRN